MDAIILAGGLGKRLRDIVSDVPKPLAPIQGKPFLDILLAQLDNRVERVILAIGYQSEKIKEYYRNASLIFSEEEVPLGTGGALKQALQLAHSSLVLVMNGDSYFDVDLESMLAFHLASQAHLTLACREVEDVSRFGSISFDENQRISAFREKEAGAGKGWINGGIYLMDKNLLDSFPDTPFSLEQEGFPHLLKKRVFAYPSAGKFIDIGTRDSYYQAQELLCNVSS